MNITRKNIYYLILFVFCFIDLNFFYLIDTTEFNILGISYTNFVFFLNIGLFLFELLRNRGKILAGINIKVLMGFCAIAFVSAFAGTVSYNQPAILGMAAQREWLSCMLLIYPMLSWLKNKKISITGLKKMFYTIAIVYVFICILQYVLVDIISFTYVEMNTRYSGERFYFETTYLAFASALSLDDFLLKQDSKGRRQKYLILLMMILFVYIVISKGRMGTVAWIGAVSICGVLHSRKNVVRRVLYCVVIFCGLVIFLNTTMGQDIIQTIFYEGSENDTLTIRNDGRIYYLSLLLSSSFSLFFGYGIPNFHWDTAQKMTNPLWNTNGTARLYLSDQGIVGYAFVYGLVGIVFWVIIMIYCFVLAYKIYKMTGKTLYLHWIIIDLIGCVSLTPSMFFNSLVFPIVFCMLVYEYYSIQLAIKESKKPENLIDEKIETGGLLWS